MTHVKIYHCWLSTEVFEPEQDHTYLVECADGYVTKGSYNGETWWVYVHEKHENHPTAPSNPVINFCDLPERNSSFSAFQQSAHWTCSNCGASKFRGKGTVDVCPNCGAKSAS